MIFVPVSLCGSAALRVNGPCPPLQFHSQHPSITSSSSSPPLPPVIPTPLRLTSDTLGRLRLPHFMPLTHPSIHPHASLSLSLSLFSFFTSLSLTNILTRYLSIYISLLKCLSHSFSILSLSFHSNITLFPSATLFIIVYLYVFNSCSPSLSD